MTLQPVDLQYEQRVRDSFSRQQVMCLIGAELVDLQPGRCEINLSYRPDLTQQNGFFHAGITSTIADSAGGYAAYTLMPVDSDVLTVEYKMNLVAPADGDVLIAKGEVIRPGKTLMVARVDVTAIKDSQTSLCATLLQTLICRRHEKQE